VAALLIAADIADAQDEATIAQYLRETADAWNANIEQWTYVQGSDVAKQVGVEGHYVRIVPPRTGQHDGSPFNNIVYVKNRPAGDRAVPVTDLISVDALALVRFGLRAPDDPHILNTVKAIDALLKINTPFGPTWHRYNSDGYGEQEDGAPFDGVGIGRGWPLLTGERAHYELAAGRRDVAEKLLHTMEAFAGNGGLLPEQVWDADDIPDKGLYRGRPSGSAMPLVWTHAEYVKLRRSLRDGRVFDMPRQAHQRYVVKKTGSPYAIWRFNTRSRHLPAGKTLRIEVHDPALVHWSSDGWQTTNDNNTHDTSLGVHIVDLPVRDLPEGSSISFTFYWPQANRWENSDFSVAVIAPPQN
jgi:glucoamylase